MGLVRDLHKRSVGVATVCSLVDLYKKLGVLLVAEGVETREEFCSEKLRCPVYAELGSALELRLVFHYFALVLHKTHSPTIGGNEWNRCE